MDALEERDLVAEAHFAAGHFVDLAVNERHEGNAAIVNALIALKCSVDALTAQLAQKP